MDLFHYGYSHYVFFFFLVSGPFSLWLWPFSLWPSVDLSHYGYCLFDSSVKFFFFISGPLLLWLFATVLYFTHCKWFPIDVLLYFKWYFPNEPHLVVSFLSVLSLKIWVHVRSNIFRQSIPFFIIRGFMFMNFINIKLYISKNFTLWSFIPILAAPCPFYQNI